MRLQKKGSHEGVSDSPLLWAESLIPPERPHYQPEETQQDSIQDGHLDHRGWWISPEGNLWLPRAHKWKVLKSLNQLYYLGLENTLMLTTAGFASRSLPQLTNQHAST
jgi:hypothetical protein